MEITAKLEVGDIGLDKAKVGSSIRQGGLYVRYFKLPRPNAVLLEL